MFWSSRPCKLLAERSKRHVRCGGFVSLSSQQCLKSSCQSGQDVRKDPVTIRIRLLSSEVMWLCLRVLLLDQRKLNGNRISQLDGSLKRPDAEDLMNWR